MNTELLDEILGRVDRSIDQLADELVDATGAELDERIRSLELLRRRVDAELAVTVAAAERRQVFLADGHRAMKGYLRATCNWSNADIAGQRRLAKATDHVPGLAEALHTGRVGTAQAAAIARVHRNPRVRDRLVEFAPTLLDLAERLCFDDFALALQRFEMLADSDGAHRDRDEQLERRNVHVTTVGGSSTSMPRAAIRWSTTNSKRSSTGSARRSSATMRRPGVPNTATTRRASRSPAPTSSAATTPSST